MLMCAHVYDVALCRNTVRMLLLVSDWLATPGLHTTMSSFEMVCLHVSQ